MGQNHPKLEIAPGIIYAFIIHMSLQTRVYSVPGVLDYLREVIIPYD